MFYTLQELLSTHQEIKDNQLQVVPAKIFDEPFEVDRIRETIHTVHDLANALALLDDGNYKRFFEKLPHEHVMDVFTDYCYVKNKTHETVVSILLADLNAWQIQLFFENIYIKQIRLNGLLMVKVTILEQIKEILNSVRRTESIWKAVITQPDIKALLSNRFGREDYNLFVKSFSRERQKLLNTIFEKEHIALGTVEPKKEQSINIITPKPTAESSKREETVILQDQPKQAIPNQFAELAQLNKWLEENELDRADPAVMLSRLVNNLFCKDVTLQTVTDLIKHLKTVEHRVQFIQNLDASMCDKLFFGNYDHNIVFLFLAVAEKKEEIEKIFGAIVSRYPYSGNTITWQKIILSFTTSVLRELKDKITEDKGSIIPAYIKYLEEQLLFLKMSKYDSQYYSLYAELGPLLSLPLVAHQIREALLMNLNNEVLRYVFSYGEGEYPFEIPPLEPSKKYLDHLEAVLSYFYFDDPTELSSEYYEIRSHSLRYLSRITAYCYPLIKYRTKFFIDFFLEKLKAAVDYYCDHKRIMLTEGMTRAKKLRSIIEECQHKGHFTPALLEQLKVVFKESGKSLSLSESLKFLLSSPISLIVPNFRRDEIGKNPRDVPELLVSFLQENTPEELRPESLEETDRASVKADKSVGDLVVSRLLSFRAKKEKPVVSVQPLTFEDAGFEMVEGRRSPVKE
jgi:hypothetical protein